TNRDVALVRLELVSATARELAVEKYVSYNVLRDHVRRSHVRQFDVAFRRNIGAHETTAKICDTDIAATCFKIDGRINRHLQFEIDIANVAFATIVAHDINYEALVHLLL